MPESEKLKIRFLNWITIKEKGSFTKTWLFGKSKTPEGEIIWFKFLLPKHYAVFTKDVPLYQGKFKHQIDLGLYKIETNTKQILIDNFYYYEKPIEEEEISILLSPFYEKIPSIAETMFNDFHWFFNLNNIRTTDCFEIDTDDPNLTEFESDSILKNRLFLVKEFTNPFTKKIPEFETEIIMFSFDLECYTLGEFNPAVNPITHCGINIVDKNNNIDLCLINSDNIPDFKNQILFENEVYVPNVKTFKQIFGQRKDYTAYYCKEKLLLKIIKGFLESDIDYILTYNGNDMDLNYINHRLGIYGLDLLQTLTPDERCYIPLIFEKNRIKTAINAFRIDIDAKNGNIFFDLHSFVKEEEKGLDTYSLEALSKKNFNCNANYSVVKKMNKYIRRAFYENFRIKNIDNISDPLLNDSSERELWKLSISKDKTKNYNILKKVIESANYVNIEFNIIKILIKEYDENRIDLYIEPFCLDPSLYFTNNNTFYLQFGKDDVDIETVYINYDINIARDMALYCLHDTKLCIRLWETYSINFKINANAFTFWLPQNKILFWGATTTTKGPILEFFMEKKLFFIVRNKLEKKNFKGAIVFDPTEKIISNPMLIYDYGSLYPNSCIFGNLSPEKHILKVLISDSPKKVRCMNNLLKLYPYPDYIIVETASNDLENYICELEIFDRREMGIIPGLLSRFISKRKEYKNLLKNAKTDLEKRLFDNLQLVNKLIANSIYGLLGTKEFNLSAIDCAKTCTTIGRFMLTYIDNVIADVEFKKDGIFVKRKHKKIWLGDELEQFYPSDKELIPCTLHRIYGDTDSIFIKLDNFDFGDKAISDEMKIWHSINNGKFLEKIINEKFLFLNFAMEFEYVLLNTIMISKKKYYGEKYAPGYKPGDAPIIAGKGYKKRDMCEYYQKISKELDKKIKLGVASGKKDTELKNEIVKDLIKEFKDLIQNQSKKVPNKLFYLTRKFSEASKTGENPNVRIIKEWNKNNPTKTYIVGDRYYYTYICDKDQEWTRKIKDKRKFEIVVGGINDEIPENSRIFYEIILQRVANRVLKIFDDQVFVNNFLKKYF